MKRVVLLITAVVLGILLSSGVALAVSNDDMSPSESLQAATQADPTTIQSEELTTSGNELKSDQGEVEVSIPANSSQDMTLGNEIGSIDVSVPGEADAVTVGGNVVYNNTLPGVDVVAQAVEGGARQMFVLDSPESESSISFSVKNAGSSLVANPGGSVSVRGADGKEIAGINTPWAVDSQGVKLDTRYTIDGNTITQHIDTADASFPVTADPTVCGDKIKRVTFGQRYGGTTMFVQPTRCGRWWNGFSGWLEAQRQGGRWYHGDTERSMWKQYQCHFQAAAWKYTWNLEPWRPNVSWGRVFATACNPPR